MKLLTLTALLLSILGCAPAAEDDTDTARLHGLFDEEWAFGLAEDPLLATSQGHHENGDRLPSVRRADEERRAGVWRRYLERLRAIDRARLETGDQVSYDVFENLLQNRIEAFELGAYRLPLTGDSGFHTDFARLPNDVPLATVDDYDDYLARLRAFPAYAGQYVEILREGIAHGITLPRVVLEGYEVTIESHVVDDPAASVFWPPFENLPATFPEDQRRRLRQEGEAAIRDAVVPGYRAFLDFMLGEYVPAARTTLGASELPGGGAYYAHLIRRFTTLDDLDADEIHEIGRQEVARIKAEMLEVIAEVGFEGGFAAFLDFLRNDPRFYAETPEALLKEASYIAKRMDGKLPSLFGNLPRLPYGVAPVPDHLAPKYTGGRYVGAARGGTQAGTYWVNTYALDSRPLYVLTALTLHEAVPGHHLQISLAQELDDLPEFRRALYLSAYGEGWGLYSEWLGLEAGLYDDPYDNFGRLTYEMWRACRLVVDTGLHVKGWTREQAMDFMASNTALSLHEVRTETDRYISWPGQALAYKLGELKIRELRRRAEEALGERFDVREFHDVVLGDGAVPLTVLERIVDRWIEETLTASQTVLSSDSSLVERYGMPKNITARQLVKRLELLDPAQMQRVYELVNYLLSSRRVAGATSRKRLLLEAPVWTADDVQRIREVQQDINAWRIPT